MSSFLVQILDTFGTYSLLFEIKINQKNFYSSYTLPIFALAPPYWFCGRD